MDVRTNSINHPMLLIDDEADNASVNTKKIIQIQLRQTL